MRKFGRFKIGSEGKRTYSEGDLREESNLEGFYRVRVASEGEIIVFLRVHIATFDEGGKLRQIFRKAFGVFREVRCGF